MKRLLSLLLLFAAILPRAQGQGADDQYVRIYSLILEGEALETEGAWAQALGRFSEAERQLGQVQHGFPEWNAQLISFRLDYVAQRIEALRPKVPGNSVPTNRPALTKPAGTDVDRHAPTRTSELRAPRPAVQAATQTVTNGVGPPSSAAAAAQTDAQLNLVREQARQLQAERDLLQAKLKEALSAQAPAIDPRELERALEQVKSLQAEAEQLRTRLAEEKARASAEGMDSEATIKTRQALAEANLRVAEQTSKAESLAEQKRALENRLALTSTNSDNGAGVDKAKKALAQANRELANQKALTTKLTDQEQALQAKLKILMREKEAAAAAKANNSAALASAQKALEQANRRLAEQTRRADELARKLAAAGQVKASEQNPRAENSQAVEAAKKELQQMVQQLGQEKERSAKLTSQNQFLETRLKTLEDGQQTVAALRQENLFLKQQLAEAKSVSPGLATAGDAGPQLAQAQEQIAALTQDKEILRIEKMALENHVQRLYATLDAGEKAAAASKPGDSDRLRELERQRDDLDTKLAATLKESAGRKAEGARRVTELEDELATLRARIEALEPRRVPFSAQELALLSKPDPAPADPQAQARTWFNQLPQAAAPLISEAQSAFAEGRLPQAEDKYTQALALAPTNVFTLANLAAVQLRRNRLAEAETNALRALACDPADSYSLFMVGYLRYRQQNFDEALDALTKAAKADPHNAQIQNYLGIVLVEKGQRAGAEAAFRRALQVEPDHADAHHNLAVFYVSQQPPSVDLARWHYQRALAGGHAKDQRLEDLLAARQ